MDTRLVSSAYFDPLRAALVEFLEEIKSLSVNGKLQLEQPRPLRYNNRQTEYEKSRINTTKIDPEQIYCVKETEGVVRVDLSDATTQNLLTNLVDPDTYLRQKTYPHFANFNTAATETTNEKLDRVASNPAFSLGSMLRYWMP